MPDDCATDVMGEYMLLIDVRVSIINFFSEASSLCPFGVSAPLKESRSAFIVSGVSTLGAASAVSGGGKFGLASIRARR